MSIHLSAVGDYVHAEDVARAIVALLRAPALRYSTYNIAAGHHGERSASWSAGPRRRRPGFMPKSLPDSDADILQDASLSDGMWGAYDISRIAAETGWRPRPVREALHAYMDWIAAERRAGA